MNYPSALKDVKTADEIAAETEALVAILFEESAAYFTVAELAWLTHFSAKLRYGTPVETEQRYLDAVMAISKKVGERKVSSVSNGVSGKPG